MMKFQGLGCCRTVIIAGLVMAAFVGVGVGQDAGAAGDQCPEFAPETGAEALQPCRSALALRPDDPVLVRRVAELEFEHGDPMRSAQLWRQLLASRGWGAGIARGFAMASWRAGDMAAAEDAFREIAERAPSGGASGDLIRFLLAFDRPEEAAAAARLAVEEYPRECELEELWGQAAAGLGDDSEAAQRFAIAVAKGCPRYRWARLGTVRQRVDRPEYRELLAPGGLVEGLDEVDDAECLERFELLRQVMVPEVADEVTGQVLVRQSAEIRFAGLGLLSAMGASAMDSWERLLLSDELMMRKHALRRIRQLEDPAFLPLLEEHLEREALPGNRNLTALVLGELLLAGGEVARGEALLGGIPAGDPSYPLARLALLDRAEAAGDYDRAVTLLDEILAASPEFGIDPEMVRRLRSLAGDPGADGSGGPAPEGEPLTARGVD